MPDYRRNWVPGGTYFFTVALLERKRDLFAGNGNRFASVVGEAGKTSLSLRHRGLGGVAGSSALRLDPAARRCGLCDPVAVDQAAFRQGFTEAGAAFGGEKTP